MSHRNNALVYVPALALLAIGIIAYVLVVRLTTPKITVLDVGQQASSAAQLTTIQTIVNQPSDSQVEQWQQASTTDTWRLDPLQTAQHLAVNYGFNSTDNYSLTTESAHTYVLVEHEDQLYRLVMYQPGKTGADGVWYIQSINRQ